MRQHDIATEGSASEPEPTVTRDPRAGRDPRADLDGPLRDHSADRGADDGLVQPELGGFNAEPGLGEIETRCFEVLVIDHAAFREILGSPEG